MLVDQGCCVLLEGQLAGQRIAFHRDAVQSALERLYDAYAPPAQFTVSDARSLWNTSRKFAVPLLAHLDRLGNTLRHGDLRTVAPGGRPVREARQGAEHENPT
jgi:selenocysteine-specific elongation factor